MRRHSLVLMAWLAAFPVRAEEPLRAGVLGDAAPFVVQKGGRLTGFTVDLFRAIAGRMQRPIVFEVSPPALLFKRLQDGTYDLLPGPINATPDRAAGMLLTEGYVWSEFQFGSRAGEPVRGFADLKGRRLAVREGSTYGDWALRNAQRYGFTILPTPSALAATQAVLRHEADVSLSGSPIQLYAASHDSGYVAGMSLPETRTHESAAVRKADVELRDEVEDALRCLKQNGTVARLSKSWFGREPDPEGLENLLVPGYGVPGLSGYDPKTHKVRC